MPNATLPDPKTAYDTLFSGIQARAFFSRLGQYGYSPASEKQAEEYLTLAGKLRMVSQDPRVKAAAASNDPVAEASAQLDNVMRQYGLDGAVKSAAAQEASVARRNASMSLAQDPNLYNAVLSLKAAEAMQVAASIGGGN